MKISKVRIENFRCIRELDVVLEDTTVFIGANNSGKTSILQAVRIALSRLWGRRGTGFTEHDVHCPEETHDPKIAPPVRVYVRLEERESETWDPDMVSALDDLVVLNDLGRNLISLRVTCAWNQESKAFEPAWEFLNPSGQPLTQKAQRATNLSGFFSYVPLFYLDALRDAAGEFNPRSSLWGGLLKSVRIPDAIQTEVQSSLDGLDTQLLAADPRLADIAKTISHAAKIAVGQSEGDAKLRMLPMNTWDLISRAAVVLKNEDLRPWLPLDHHGQGLQSLSVLFLFQAAAFQQLEEDQPGIEPIFLLEEPEAHLHPQAARILWDRVSELPGQKLVATHSPYFVQHVPLHNLRLVRLHQGRTELAFMPRSVVSDLPWNEGVAQLAAHQGQMLTKDPATEKVSASSWFDEATAAKLAGCYKSSTDQELIRTAIANLRHESRGMLTRQEEHELSFLGRRIRGEIFFARRWILVEGQSEYVLLHAIGRALEYPLDRHGISVIDFQNNGDADTYAALATSFAIPWWMITDADDEATKFRAQLIKRGFVDADLVDRVTTLTPPNSLEDQLLADGHETRLRAILAEATSNSALTCPLDDFLKRLKNKKIPCISRLALQVEADVTLAQAMPKPFVDLVQALKGGAL
jgi:putative ATP-dependent endonuclease of the OLD family